MSGRRGDIRCQDNKQEDERKMKLSGEQRTYSTVHSSSSTAHFTCTPCTHSSSSIGRVTITLKIPQSQSWCLYNALVILTITTQVEQLTSNQRQTYSTYVQKSRTHAHMHACTHARTHTHTHTVHTYIHMYIHTCKPGSPCLQQRV